MDFIYLTILSGLPSGIHRILLVSLALRIIFLDFLFIQKCFTCMVHQAMAESLLAMRKNIHIQGRIQTHDRVS
jgi:hypothetical protein